MPRQLLVINNKDIQLFLSQFVGDRLYTSDLPSWVEDCLSGAARSGYSRPTTSYHICIALLSLSEISFSSVEMYVNRLRVVLGFPPFSRSYIHSYMSRLLAARNSIKHMYWKLNHKDFPVYIDNTPENDFRYFDGILKTDLQYL